MEPCQSSSCSIEDIIMLIESNMLDVVTVIDTHGKCRDLLSGAVDLFNTKLAASRIKEIIKSGKRVIVVDARNLPHRPRNPFLTFVNALECVAIEFKITIVYYTEDPEGKPRWVNPGGTYIKCILQNAFTH